MFEQHDTLHLTVECALTWKQQKFKFYQYTFNMWFFCGLLLFSPAVLSHPLACLMIAVTIAVAGLLATLAFEFIFRLMGVEWLESYPRSTFIEDGEVLIIHRKETLYTTFDEAKISIGGTFGTSSTDQIVLPRVKYLRISACTRTISHERSPIHRHKFVLTTNPDEEKIAKAFFVLTGKLPRDTLFVR